MTIRLRLSLWYAATLVVLFAAVGGIVWYQYGRMVRDTVDQELAARADDISSSLGKSATASPDTDRSRLARDLRGGLRARRHAVERERRTRPAGHRGAARRPLDASPGPGRRRVRRRGGRGTGRHDDRRRAAARARGRGPRRSRAADAADGWRGDPRRPRRWLVAGRPGAAPGQRDGPRGPGDRDRGPRAPAPGPGRRRRAGPPRPHAQRDARPGRRDRPPGAEVRGHRVPRPPDADRDPPDRARAGGDLRARPGGAPGRHPRRPRRRGPAGLAGLGPAAPRRGRGLGPRGAPPARRRCARSSTA